MKFKLLLLSLAFSPICAIAQVTPMQQMQQAIQMMQQAMQQMQQMQQAPQQTGQQGTLVNIALKKPATQSSEGFGGAAARANDGNANPTYSANSINHTNNGPNEFWMVNLQGNFAIAGIKITNRADCCTDRIVGATVQVLDNAGQVKWSAPITAVAPMYQFAVPSGIVGSFVRVLNKPGQYLHMAEVEVFGVAASNAPTNIATTALTMVSGDMQTAARNQMSNGIPTAMYAPLVVVAKDGTGKPLPGVAVTWSVGAKPGAMACQIEPSGASQGSVTTDAAGQAVLAKMGGRSTSIYYADGECQIVATYGGSSVSFRLNAAP